MTYLRPVAAAAMLLAVAACSGPALQARLPATGIQSTGSAGMAGGAAAAPASSGTVSTTTRP